MSSSLAAPRVVNIADLRRIARRRLPRVVFDYIDGGADAEVTLRRNCEVYESVAFRPRSAVALEGSDLRTTVLGVDVALPVLERSLEQVRAVLDGWEAGTMHLTEWDRAVLKRALKAYRKRLKLMRLDDESSASRNPLSKGETSHILGVRPPEQYPAEIWEYLVKQGKLRDGGHGLLELATI